MLKVRVENLGQITILHVAGHIVIGTEIETLRRAVLSQSEAGTVVLDLKHVSRIDARGLGLFLELREQLQAKSREFQLMNVSRLVGQILKITCLDSVFEIAHEGEIRARDLRQPIPEASLVTPSERSHG